MISNSILIPVYNAEKTLRQCLNSCWDKSNVHVFLDQCDDLSFAIASEYDIHITVSPVRHGHAAARQHLFWHSHTDAVVFQDADDWRTEHYDYHVRQLEFYDVLITPFICEDGQPHLVEQSGNVLQDLIYGRVQTGGIYWRSSTLRKLEFATTTKWEYWMLYRAYLADARIGYCDRPGVHYRRNWSDSQLTRQPEWLAEHARFATHLLARERLTNEQQQFLGSTIRYAKEKARQQQINGT